MGLAREKMSKRRADNNDGWIVHVPSTLPNEVCPYAGIFHRSHIQSANRYWSQIVYYAYALPAQQDVSLPKFEDRMATTEHDGTTYRQITRRYAKRKVWPLTGLVHFLVWIARNRERIKLLHAHGAAWGGIWCIVARRLFGIPAVLSEHSSGFALKSFGQFFHALFRIFLPKTTAIFPVTTNLGGFIKSFAQNVPQHVVHNCIDTQMFQAAPMPPKKVFRILFIGSFVPIKRIDLLIKACARVAADFKMQIRLGGQGPLQNDMIAFSDALGLKDKTEFLGSLSRYEVRQELVNCHTLVLSSKWESQPCVLIEALCSGRPVVAPKVGGIPEMINENNGILFEPENEDDLVLALLRIAANLNKYNPEAIAAEARKTYSYDSVGRTLSGLYEKYSL